MHASSGTVDRRNGRPIPANGRHSSPPPPRRVSPKPPPRGHRVPTLSASRVVYQSLGRDYYYDNGIYYVGDAGYYVVTPAPYGFMVPSLPLGFLTYFLDGIAYYYFGGTYYLWNGEAGAYEVIAPPDQVQSMVAADEAAGENVPEEGTPDQAEAVVQEGSALQETPPEIGEASVDAAAADKESKDRYECHRWTVYGSGFDPSSGNQGAVKATDEQIGQYNKTLTNCLKVRGYVIATP